MINNATQNSDPAFGGTAALCDHPDHPIRQLQMYSRVDQLPLLGQQQERSRQMDVVPGVALVRLPQVIVIRVCLHLILLVSDNAATNPLQHGYCAAVPALCIALGVRLLFTVVAPARPIVF